MMRHIKRNLYRVEKRILLDFANSLENSFQTLDGLLSHFSGPSRHHEVADTEEGRGRACQPAARFDRDPRITWRLGSNVFSVSVAAPDAGMASSKSTAEEARGRPRERRVQ